MRAWLKVGTPQFEQAGLKDGDTVEMWRPVWRGKIVGTYRPGASGARVFQCVVDWDAEGYMSHRLDYVRVEQGDFIKLIDLGEGLPNVEGGK